jgi:hypothetical protein
MYCTCGERMKPHKVGELLIKDGYLFSCDSFQCPSCKKTVIGSVANTPLCLADSDEATKTIDNMLERGYMTYGTLKEYKKAA